MADPMEEEKKPSKEEESVLEIIDDVESPEQLEAARELFIKPSEPSEEEKQRIKAEEQKPKEKTEAEKAAEIKAAEEETEEEKAAKIKAAEEKAAEESDKKIIEITDEYIEAADEKDKAALIAIKGESTSGKILKNYLESQKLIGKKSTEIFKLKSGQEEERQPKEVHLDNEMRGIIAGAAKKQLRQEYPDMPEEAEEYKEWALAKAGTDPDAAQEFYDRRKDITSNLTEDYKQMVYVRENYDVINYNTMKDEVKSVEKVFDDVFGFKPNDIGLNLAVDKEFSNEMINEILVNDKGDFDPQLVTFYDKRNKEVPILNEGMFMYKFFSLHLPKVIDEIRKRARKEGFESRDKKVVVKELTDISTEKDGDVKTEKLRIDDIEDIDDLEKIRDLRERVSKMIGSE